jgi:hypothetical protein
LRRGIHSSRIGASTTKTAGEGGGAFAGGGLPAASGLLGGAAVVGAQPEEASARRGRNSKPRRLAVLGTVSWGS